MAAILDPGGNPKTTAWVGGPMNVLLRSVGDVGRAGPWQRMAASLAWALTLTGPFLACARVSTDQGNAVTDAGKKSGGSGGATTASMVDGGGVADRYTLPDGLVNADVTLGGADAACATQSAMAETLPLDLYVMIDSSGSMAEATAAGPTKWQAVKDALTAFFRDSQSAGLGIGLQYFPLVQPGAPATCLVDGPCGTYGPCLRLHMCFGPNTTKVVTCEQSSDCARGEMCYLIGNCVRESQYACAVSAGGCAANDTCAEIYGYCTKRDKCDVQSYATPAVPIATLPGAATALVNSLNGHQPDGLTPTAAALSGAISAAQAHAAAHAGHKTAVVLVTDGFPTECTPVDIPGIAQIARTGAGGTPSVPTFVIGVFAPADQAMAATNLDALAASGGTGKAVVISTSQNVTQSLQTALSQIRTTAVSCEYKIPPASAGAIDFTKVNVQFTDASGKQTAVGYVNGKANCSATKGGWYYDVDPSTGQTPTSIITCDATCTQFRGATISRVDIVLGCQTITIL